MQYSEPQPIMVELNLTPVDWFFRVQPSSTTSSRRAMVT